ncbi:hypothetical protein ACFSM5_15690 [Lacibacterium aquatile]|uniref:GpE family phage tail protein n=1 Tax=Lacibacterium aquatile TaxID=1168082 RepID=A0ABW5DWN8_9PROT
MAAVLHWPLETIESLDTAEFIAWHGAAVDHLNRVRPVRA